MRLWKLLLAYFHASDAAVCEMSRGGRDYHDWMDGALGGPSHFHDYQCTRCGKVFQI